MNQNREFVNPAEPNGYKFETLALDMLQFMNDCLPFEVVRDYEFAPIKNAEGADSPETAKGITGEKWISIIIKKKHKAEHKNIKAGETL